MARPRRPRRYKRPPEGVFTATIDDLAHDGRGAARVDGKTTFVHGALPGERVTFSYHATHSQYDEARVETVLDASPDRAEPRCAHFGRCGGCALQHLAAERQIDYKQGWLLDNLRRIGKVVPQTLLAPLSGPHYGYRYKARLGVKYVAGKGRVLVGFRERETRYIAELCRCEVLHPRVGALLDELSALVGALSVYRRLPQIEVAAGDDAVALSFRVLDPPSDADRAALIAFGREHDVQIYIQTKGPATTEALWPAHAGLRYALPEHHLELAFLPYHFTQVNPAINRRMIDRALALLALTPDDRVLDLFCGLGNFTLALARYAGHAVGVDGERALIERAAANAAANRVDNAEFIAADLYAEPGDAPWLRRGYDKVLLDPPRSGARLLMPLLAELGPRRILYVSCHPATLARDAGMLVNDGGYTLSRAGVMDMFPHTAHVESIALFER